jgi:hypothetical protein
MSASCPAGKDSRPTSHVGKARASETAYWPKGRRTRNRTPRAPWVLAFIDMPQVVACILQGSQRDPTEPSCEEGDDVPSRASSSFASGRPRIPDPPTKRNAASDRLYPMRRRAIRLPYRAVSFSPGEQGPRRHESAGALLPRGILARKRPEMRPVFQKNPPRDGEEGTSRGGLSVPGRACWAQTSPLKSPAK